MSIIATSVSGITQNVLSEATPFLMAFVFGLLVGSLAPTYYAGEKLRGFGRAMLNKLPYEPPPGKEKEEALIEATDEDVSEEQEEEKESESNQ